MQFIWLMVLISSICLANARQIRYNRYNTEVIEESENKQNSANVTDNQTLAGEHEVEATVREIKLAPYPAVGFRPSRAFPMPNEAAAQVTDESPIALSAEEIDFTTTTQVYESETTTINNVDEENSNKDDRKRVDGGDDVLAAKAAAPKAPYPPAGFQPKMPFLLPADSMMFKGEQQQEASENLTEIPIEESTEMPAETKVKTPYPAAGYRPSKAFLLPSEQFQLENKEGVNTKTDNSGHPVCGSSTNPLAPKPLDGEKEDPDSETINVNTQTQIKSQQQRAVVIPIRFSVHPLLLSRPLVYSAPIPSSR